MKTKATNIVAHVALLRGINVGGRNLLPMAELVKMFAAAGCGHVRTFIQSGNVLFDAAPGFANQLPKTVSAQIEKKFGLKVPVIVRSTGELEKAVSHNPFLKNGTPEEMLHVMFLANAPRTENVSALDPKRLPPDEFILRGREIYLKMPNGVARSKLTNAYFDSKLGTVSTSRNWRTVLKLLRLSTTGT